MSHETSDNSKDIHDQALYDGLVSLLQTTDFTPEPLGDYSRERALTSHELQLANNVLASYELDDCDKIVFFEESSIPTITPSETVISGSQSANILLHRGLVITLYCFIANHDGTIQAQRDICVDNPPGPKTHTASEARAFYEDFDEKLAKLDNAEFLGMLAAFGAAIRNNTEMTDLIRNDQLELHERLALRDIIALLAN